MLSIPQEVASLRHPLGVFDSGVGGLTVLHALRRRMPQQDFIYFGDTARVPYGRKPREMVEQFATGITEFLVGLGVQGVVIACNTASSAALPQLAGRTPVPVWGVIEPGVEAARRATRSGRVGVIGTKGTIAARSYQHRLEALGLEVWAQACPMLVPLVEEGLANSREAELLAHYYLDSQPGIDTLILGCTHYPLLRDVLQRAAGDQIVLVDSAEVTAGFVSDALASRVALPANGHAGRVVHFVTGDAAAYLHTSRTVSDVEGVIIPLDITRLPAAAPTAPAAGLPELLSW